jgi:hypothetical protein
LKKRIKKQVEKIIKKERATRSFHPAVRLLNEADHELVVFKAFAKAHGIEFDQHRGENGRFTAAAPRVAREPRKIIIFAQFETSDGKDIDIRFGMKLEFYDPDERHQALVQVTLSRRLSKDAWQLARERVGPRRKPDPGTERVLRRLGLADVEARMLGSKDLYEHIGLMCRDYQEAVLIPRGAREKGKKR